MIDICASGDLARTAYIEKDRANDAELDELKGTKEELVRCLPLLHRRQAIDATIAPHCEIAKLRYQSNLALKVTS